MLSIPISVIHLLHLDVRGSGIVEIVASPGTTTFGQDLHVFG